MVTIKTAFKKVLERIRELRYSQFQKGFKKRGEYNPFIDSRFIYIEQEEEIADAYNYEEMLFIYCAAHKFSYQKNYSRVIKALIFVLHIVVYFRNKKFV